MKMTNAQFGATVGIGESYVSYLRAGVRKPSGDVLVRIVLRHFDDPDDMVTALRAYEQGREAFGEFLTTQFFTADKPAEVGA